MRADLYQSWWDGGCIVDVFDRSAEGIFSVTKQTAPPDSGEKLQEGGKTQNKPTNKHTYIHTYHSSHGI